MTAVPNTEFGAPIALTDYDREACNIGVVHLGYGAFHRAHQAVYIDDYMSETGDLAWGIAAVNLRAAEAQSFRLAQSNDGYVLKTTTPAGESQFRLVRSHCRFADWSNDPGDAEDLLSLPTTHLVTITVTESGYYLRDDGTLNAEDPTIAAETKGGSGQSVYAYLARALAKRAARINQPINVVCCDNFRSNGNLLEHNFTAYLRLTGQTELAMWVNENASFPCSMVDRITPRVTTEVEVEVAQLFPMQSMSPIHGEAFKQWVIEDSFKAPMPNLDRVGVEFVDDVHPFEEAKIRILNGGHTSLCYLGALAGFRTFDQAMHDKELRAFFDAFQLNEILPGLRQDLPFDKRKYLDSVAARFSNAAIADQLERLCADGYSKFSIYIRPTIQSCLEQGIVPRLGFRSIASWYVYARRSDAGVMPVTYHEPYWDQLRPLLTPGAESEFAHTRQLWGDLPDNYAEFSAGVVNAIKEMEAQWPA